MFNNIFSEMNIKKVIHWGGRRNGGTVLISSWKCNYSIYFEIQVYHLDIEAISTLLCLLFVLYVLFPSILSSFYITTALLKIDVFRHSTAYFIIIIIIKKRLAMQGRERVIDTLSARRPQPHTTNL